MFRQARGYCAHGVDVGWGHDGYITLELGTYIHA